MASSGIKNWHWRTKGVEPWAKDWFRSNLTGVDADGVKIDEVTDVEGDAELGMRKSKLVTIYDQKITMRWLAADDEGTEIKGTLVAVEVAHDMDEDEYEFTSSLDSGDSSKKAAHFHGVAKKQLANKLRPIFQKFPRAMIETHGKDILAAAEDAANASSGATTPSAPSAPTQTGPTKPATAAGGAANEAKTVNSTTVKVEDEFQVTAEDLFELLTNEQKIPMWTRNPAKMQPSVGSDVSLFGGNIAGKVTAVDRPKSISHSWRAPTWPEGYYGTLDMLLRQGANSTTLTLRLTGVPVGKEDEAERNMNVFYIQGLKSIGLVSLPSSTPTRRSKLRRRSAAGRGAAKPDDVSWLKFTTVMAGPFVVSAGVIVACLAAFYYGPSGPGGKAK